jgi:hypothetical protein
LVEAGEEKGVGDQGGISGRKLVPVIRESKRSQTGERLVVFGKLLDLLGVASDHTDGLAGAGCNAGLMNFPIVAESHQIVALKIFADVNEINFTNRNPFSLDINVGFQLVIIFYLCFFAHLFCVLCPAVLCWVMKIFRLQGCLAILLLGSAHAALTDEAGLELPESDVAAIKNVPLPDIGGSVDVPDSWNLWTREEAQLSVEKVEFETPEAKAWSEGSVASVGTSMVVISKYPEPYTEGVNPLLTINWVDMPPELKRVPEEKRSEVLAQALSRLAVPALGQALGESGFIPMGEPEPFGPEHKHQGALLTYQTPMKLKSGPLIGPVTRTFLLFGKDHLIIASLVLPKNEGSANDAAALQNMMMSLDYARAE